MFVFIFIASSFKNYWSFICIIQSHLFVSFVFSEAVQDKLLSDYEAEMKKDASKKPSHAKKDSNASDDWEKLSDDASSKWNKRNWMKPFCIFAEFYLYILYCSIPFSPRLLLPCTASYAELWKSYSPMASQLCMTPKSVIHTVPVSQVEQNLLHFWEHVNCGAYIL